MEKEKHNNSILQERINTKLTLRKKKIQNELAKKQKFRNELNQFKIGNFKESDLEIKADELKLKSEVKNKHFHSDDLSEYYDHIMQLIESEEEDEKKYGIFLFKNIICTLIKQSESNLPKQFKSIETLTKLYFCMKGCSSDYSIKVS